MGTAFYVLAGAGLLVVGFLSSAIWYRPKKGRFQVLSRGSRSFVFRSNFGEFTIDGANGQLFQRSKKGVNGVPLADIRRLNYGYKEKEAVAEELLGGWNIWDFSKTYRDVTGWFTISAVLADDTRLPLYAIGQYEPREPLSGWWFNLQKELLARVGLFADVEGRARGVLEELQAAFSAAGRPLELT